MRVREVRPVERGASLVRRRNVVPLVCRGATLLAVEGCDECDRRRLGIWKG